MRGLAQKQMTNLAGSVIAVVVIALFANLGRAGSRPSNQIRDIQVAEKGDKTVITIVGSKRPSFTAFKLMSPKRLVIDFANSKVRGVPSIIDKTTGIVRGVAVSEYSVKDMPVSRVMINFQKDAAYRVRVKGNKLIASLTGSPQPKKRLLKQQSSVDGKVGAEIIKARTEAKKAKRLHEEALAELEKIKSESTKHRAKAEAEIAKARAESRDAKKLHKEAETELKKIKTEISKRRFEVDKAKKEAQKAHNRLKQAQAARIAKDKKQKVSVSDEVARAAKQIEKYRSQVARAETLARQEREKRAKIEEGLASLKKQLNSSRQAEQRASHALSEAKQEATELKQEAETRAAHATAAKQEAEVALSAQNRAAKNYRKAAEGEREELLRILKSKEEETDVAKQKVVQTRQEQKKTLKELGEAIRKLDKATGEARKAARAEERIQLGAERELALAEKRILKARKATELAEQRADEARSEKQLAERKAERIRQEAEQAKIITERRADERISAAQYKFEAAKNARETAEKQLLAAEQKVAQSEKKTTLAETRADKFAKKLADAKKQAVLAEKRAQQFAKKLAKSEEKADRFKRQANKYAGDLKETETKASQFEKRADKYAKELKETKTKANQLEKRADKYAKDLKETETKASQFEKRADKYAKKLMEKETRANQFEKRADKYAKELMEKETRASQFEKRADKYAKELMEKETRASQFEKRADKYAKELKETETKASQLRKRVVRSEKDLAGAKTTISNQEKQIGEMARKEAAWSQKEKSYKQKLSQEEIRLRRLAEMRRGKGEVAKKKTSSVEKNKAAPMIEDIEFIDEGDSQKVVIKTTSPLLYTTSTDDNGNASIAFKGAALAPMLERSLDVTDFSGVIGSVNSYRDGNEARIDVKVERIALNSITHTENEIEWTFAPKTRKTRGKKPTQLPKGTETRTVAREDGSAYAYPFERTAGISASSSRKKKKKRYTGRHIDLDFKDADIHNILRLLSDVGHVNIITADDVKGTVTIRMRDVAWDHALDVILQTKRLGMIREGNLIRVAPLEVLEKEREMEIARRKQKVALEPLETRLIPVSYAVAGELSPRAADLVTERGKLSVDARTNVIIARDTRGALDQIEALIRNLDTQTPQVLIESRIVEATSTYSREIGIQWGGDFSASGATGNPTGLAFPNAVSVAGGATDNKTPIAGMTAVTGGMPNPNFAVNLPAAVGTGSGGALGITLGSIANNANLSLRLSAMEESGTLRILSSPRILTLDNREAHIEQGTLIPYSQISAQGVQTAFKEAKLNLTVTPHVTADGSVMLAMKVMRDEPDFNNTGARGDPTILKREAETELLVSDGHTAVIGGIFTRNHGTSYKKVPFFADIPIIGWLFKSRSDSDRRSEMLIFITPRIVNRAESIGQ
ncbi:MAG: type IV pilus secretin PilQ [Proteobacteria bacterium]|nr:type IV pilus secretin PilQ [Pseudomonadota bacterium]